MIVFHHPQYILLSNIARTCERNLADTTLAQIAVPKENDQIGSLDFITQNSWPSHD